MNKFKEIIAGLLGTMGFVGIGFEADSIQALAIKLAACIALIATSIAIFSTTEKWHKTSGRV